MAMCMWYPTNRSCGGVVVVLDAQFDPHCLLYVQICPEEEGKSAIEHCKKELMEKNVPAADLEAGILPGVSSFPSCLIGIQYASEY